MKKEFIRFRGLSSGWLQDAVFKEGSVVPVKKCHLNKDKKGVKELAMWTSGGIQQCGYQINR